MTVRAALGLAGRAGRVAHCRRALLVEPLPFKSRRRFREQRFVIERVRERRFKRAVCHHDVLLDGFELRRDFFERGQQTLVNDHDFESESLGKAVPYGIYEVNHNRGYVYLGKSADTAEFAVDMLSSWWQEFGRHEFPTAPCLLALCDCGGSNGYRSRLWKAQLQEKMADALGVEVMVCHYPTGASKWNPIEHRLFGPISLNWAGKPLRTFETMLAYIRGTTTKTGLQVSAFLTEQTYARGIKVADEIMHRLNLTRHATCPNWNYTIHPRTAAIGI